MDANRDTVALKNMLAIARRKKKSKNKSLRSQMLRMIMPYLSRESGDKLAKAIEVENPVHFRKVWDEIRDSISDRLKSTSSSFDDELLEEMKDLILKDMESTSSSGDFSFLLAGSDEQTKNVRDLMSSGWCRINDKVLKIRNCKVVESNSNNVIFKVSASFDGKLVDKTGTLAEASTEIVIDAMSVA